MKIQMLSLEDLSESTTDVVVPADIGEDELQELRDDTQAREAQEAEETEIVADEVEGESLLDQAVALEQLYDKIEQLEVFTIHHAMEAYDAAPDAYIMETFKSGATNQAKLSVAMEGVMAKAWEAVKRFWVHLVQMWKKFCQYVDRFLNGGGMNELKVDQKLVTQVEAILHEGSQRLQHNQHNGLLVRDNPEENSLLKRSWVHAGEGKMAEAFGKVKQILPKSNQFVQVTEKYVRDLENWASDSIKHPDAQTVMPASPESTMYDYVENCGEMVKAIRLFFVTREYDRVPRVPLNAILTQIQSVVITAEYGLERALGESTRTVMRFVDKRSDELQTMLKKEDVEANKAKVYRALGQELGSLRAVVADVFLLFFQVREGQARILKLGEDWLYAVHKAYEDMGSSDKHYSDQDKTAFRAESEFFLKLSHAYKKLISKKAESKMEWKGA